MVANSYSARTEQARLEQHAVLSSHPLRTWRRALLAGTALRGGSVALVLIAAPAGVLLPSAAWAGGAGGTFAGAGGAPGFGGSGSIPAEGGVGGAPSDTGVGGDGVDALGTLGGGGGGGGGASGGSGGTGVAGSGGSGGAHGYVGNGLPDTSVSGDGGNPGAQHGGGGGGGGYGAVVQDAVHSEALAVDIAGGSGGHGGQGINGGGGGGGGGIGLRMLGAVDGLVIGGGVEVKGGHGGDGGFGTSNFGAGGGGGGGQGAVFGAAAEGVVVEGAVLGGNGGAGGGTNSGFAGSGGSGGAGMRFEAGGSLTVGHGGSITGGEGGAVGQVFGFAHGAGGAGIVGSDLTITLDDGSTVSGGLSGGGVQADAITFTGGANVLSFGGETSGLTGNIGIVSGSLIFSQGNGITTTVANVITGNGSVIKAGDGVLILSDDNTFSGGVTLAGGGIIMGHNNALGTGTFTVLGNLLIIQNGITIGNDTDLQADLDINVDPGATGTHAGDIASTGVFGIDKIGAGTLVLSGTNTYTGATNANAGTLGAGAENAFSASSAHVIAAGAVLDLNDFSQTIGSLAGAGDVTLGTATLTAGGDNTSTSFSGIMSGDGGFTKQGTGTLTFSGTNSYSGDTDVNSGTLLVNGSIASSALTTVGSGAVLGGDGIVGDTMIGAGGTLSPGNSIGQLDVDGKLTFDPLATYLVEIDPTDADRTDATGSASLAGTVNAQFAPGAYAVNQYTILTADGGLGGTTFDTLATDNLPAGFAASLDYQGNDVLLNLSAALGLGQNLSQNPRDVADALNGFFNNGGMLPPDFVTLFGLTGDALSNGLSQASGEPGASVSQPIFMAWTQFFNMIFDPFSGNRGMNGEGGGLSQPERLASPAMMLNGGLTDMVTEAAPSVPAASRWSMWGGGYGGWATTGGNAQVGSHDTTSRAYGFAIGADHRLTPDTLIGFALAGGGTSFGQSQGLGGGKSDLLQASAYARQQWGAAYLMGAFGYGWQDSTLDRTVTIAGTDTLEADFHAHTLAGRAEGGWRWGSAIAGITPYAAIQATSIDLPGFAERAVSGANTFALVYDGRTDTQTRSELGARLDLTMPIEDGLLTLRGRAAWAHDFDTGRIADAAFQALPGAVFTVNGAHPDQDSLLLSAGAEIALRSGLSFAGSFEGELSSNTESYAGKGTLRYRW